LQKQGNSAYRQRMIEVHDLYFNDFNGPLCSKYPEWTSSAITYASTANPPGKGTLPPQVVTNVESPNHAQRFLGEFGGPQIGVPGDPGYNQTRVEQTVSLTLRDLPSHATLKVSFDLYILKSWDGLSPAYGPDHWSLGVAGGPILFNTSFSNNPKVKTEGSYQHYFAALSTPPPKADKAPFNKGQWNPTVVFNPSFGNEIGIPFRLIFYPAAHSSPTKLFLMAKRGILCGLDDEILHRNSFVLCVIPLRHNTRTQRRGAKGAQHGLKAQSPCPLEYDC